MKRWIVVLGCIVVLSAGCAENDLSLNGTEESKQLVEEMEGSYASILILDGKRYSERDIVEEGTYTIKEEIGEVQEKVAMEVMPNHDFQSNVLSNGTKIYSIEEDPNLFLTQHSGQVDYGVYKQLE